jgi:hypothetical protein
VSIKDDPDWSASEFLEARRASLLTLCNAMKESNMLEHLVVSASVLRLGWEIIALRDNVLQRMQDGR